MAQEKYGIGAVVPWAPDVVRKAQLTVCREAADVDEARELLAMLGICEVAE